MNDKHTPNIQQNKNQEANDKLLNKYLKEVKKYQTVGSFVANPVNSNQTTNPAVGKPGNVEPNNKTQPKLNKPNAAPKTATLPAKTTSDQPTTSNNLPNDWDQLDYANVFNYLTRAQIETILQLDHNGVDEKLIDELHSQAIQNDWREIDLHRWLLAHPEVFNRFNSKPNAPTTHTPTPRETVPEVQLTTPEFALQIPEKLAVEQKPIAPKTTQVANKLSLLAADEWETNSHWTDNQPTEQSVVNKPNSQVFSSVSPELLPDDFDLPVEFTIHEKTKPQKPTLAKTAKPEPTNVLPPTPHKPFVPVEEPKNTPVTQFYKPPQVVEVMPAEKKVSAQLNSEPAMSNPKSNQFSKPVRQNFYFNSNGAKTKQNQKSQSHSFANQFGKPSPTGSKEFFKPTAQPHVQAGKNIHVPATQPVTQNVYNTPDNYLDLKFEQLAKDIQNIDHQIENKLIKHSYEKLLLENQSRDLKEYLLQNFRKDAVLQQPVGFAPTHFVANNQPQSVYHYHQTVPTAENQNPAVSPNQTNPTKHDDWETYRQSWQKESEQLFANQQAQIDAQKKVLDEIQTNLKQELAKYEQNLSQLGTNQTAFLAQQSSKWEELNNNVNDKLSKIKDFLLTELETHKTNQNEHLSKEIASLQTKLQAVEAFQANFLNKFNDLQKYLEQKWEALSQKQAQDQADWQQIYKNQLQPQLVQNITSQLVNKMQEWLPKEKEQQQAFAQIQAQETKILKEVGQLAENQTALTKQLSSLAANFAKTEKELAEVAKTNQNTSQKLANQLELLVGNQTALQTQNEHLANGLKTLQEQWFNWQEQDGKTTQKQAIQVADFEQAQHRLQEQIQTLNNHLQSMQTEIGKLNQNQKDLANDLVNHIQPPLITFTQNTTSNEPQVVTNQLNEPVWAQNGDAKISKPVVVQPKETVIVTDQLTSQPVFVPNLETNSQPVYVSVEPNQTPKVAEVVGETSFATGLTQETKTSSVSTGLIVEKSDQPPTNLVEITGETDQFELAATNEFISSTLVSDETVHSLKTTETTETLQTALAADLYQELESQLELVEIKKKTLEDKASQPSVESTATPNSIALKTNGENPPTSSIPTTKQLAKTNTKTNLPTLDLSQTFTAQPISDIAKATKPLQKKLPTDWNYEDVSAQLVQKVSAAQDIESLQTDWNSQPVIATQPEQPANAIEPTFALNTNTFVSNDYDFDLNKNLLEPILPNAFATQTPPLPLHTQTNFNNAQFLQPEMVDESAEQMQANYAAISKIKHEIMVDLEDLINELDALNVSKEEVDSVQELKKAFKKV